MQAVTRVGIACLVLVAALCLATMSQAKPRNWQDRYEVWMPGHWQRLAECESGSKPPNWRHNSGTYEGAFGFYHGSWDAFKPPGYPSNAYQATPWQQYQVALRIAWRYGLASPWGCWRGDNHAWVRGGVPYNARK